MYKNIKVKIKNSLQNECTYVLDFVFMARCTYYSSQDICYKGKIADISKAIIL